MQEGNGGRENSDGLGQTGELCMKWKFAQCDEQICALFMGMLIVMIIISGEICQFIFSPCTLRMSIPNWSCEPVM